MTRWAFRIVVRGGLFDATLGAAHRPQCVCMVCCYPVEIEVVSVSL